MPKHIITFPDGSTSVISSMPEEDLVNPPPLNVGSAGDGLYTGTSDYYKPWSESIDDYHMWDPPIPSPPVKVKTDSVDWYERLKDKLDKSVVEKYTQYFKEKIDNTKTEDDFISVTYPKNAPEQKTFIDALEDGIKKKDKEIEEARKRLLTHNATGDLIAASEEHARINNLTVHKHKYQVKKESMIKGYKARVISKPKPSLPKAKKQFNPSPDIQLGDSMGGVTMANNSTQLVDELQPKSEPLHPTSNGALHAWSTPDYLSVPPNFSTSFYNRLTDLVQDFNRFRSKDIFSELMQELEYPDPWPKLSKISSIQFINGKIEFDFYDDESASQEGKPLRFNGARLGIQSPRHKDGRPAYPSLPKPTGREIPVHQTRTSASGRTLRTNRGGENPSDSPQYKSGFRDTIQ